MIKNPIAPHITSNNEFHILSPLYEGILDTQAVHLLPQEEFSKSSHVIELAILIAKHTKYESKKNRGMEYSMPAAICVKLHSSKSEFCDESLSQVQLTIYFGYVVLVAHQSFKVMIIMMFANLNSLKKNEPINTT